MKIPVASEDPIQQRNALNWGADVHRWWKGTVKKRADYRRWLSPYFALDLVYNLVFKFAVEK
jgi:hypothetical protein